MKHVMIVMTLFATLTIQASMAHAEYGRILSPPSFPESSGPPPVGIIDDSIAHRLTIGTGEDVLNQAAGPCATCL